MWILDELLGALLWYRRWRGGRWVRTIVPAEPMSEWDSTADYERWERRE